MKLFEKTSLPYLPYNYKVLQDIEIEEQGQERNITENFVAVKELMTNKHSLNHYYLKPLTKYFKEDVFSR